MFMKPLAIAAGLLAAPAVAFLIPPEISETDIEIATNEAFSGSKISEIQPIHLECPGCPILVKGRPGSDVLVQTEKTSNLELTFSIEHKPEGDRLVVNDFGLYPSIDRFPSNLVATQTLEKDDDGDQKRPSDRRVISQPQRLGFSMHVGSSKKASDGNFELVEVKLQIVEVGFSFVKNIPSLKINLIKDNNGKLLMSHIEKVVPPMSVETANSQMEKCTTVMCKIMAITQEKMKEFRKMRPSFGCHGKNKSSMMRPDGHHPHHEHPHHPHPNGIVPPHLQFSQREHSWGKLFKNIFSHILLPVLIGIVAGVSVSLIGMVVGTVIVSIWRFFFRKPSSSHRHHRRHSRSHSHHKVSHKEAVVAEEKSGLLEESQEAPPVYEDEVPDTKPTEV